MKILVTTDFSSNSKAAIRFAQTLAKQAGSLEVVFYHAVQMMKPTSWSDRFYKNYKEEEIQRLTADLTKFVIKALGNDVSAFSSMKYVVENCLSSEESIMRYATKNRMDSICIATAGAGVLRKIVGTHTSHVVRNAKAPVLVIPSHYRAKSLKKITYLSDFEKIKSELSRVKQIGDDLKCSIEVLHYTSLLENDQKLKRNIESLKNGGFDTVSWNIRTGNLETTLISKVSAYVSKSKPELLVMFTKKKKSFFESIFLPSKSAELTYTTKVPVLVISK